MVRSTSDPGGTFPVRLTTAGAPIASPSVKTTAYEDVQVQVPILRSRQVLLNDWPGAIFSPSAMVTSARNWAWSQAWVAVGVNVVVGLAAGAVIAAAGVVAWLTGRGVRVWEAITVP